MRLIAFDFAVKRIATLDAALSDGAEHGVSVGNVGAATGAATASGVSAAPGRGLAQGATIYANAGSDNGERTDELEPLRIYPWQIDSTTNYRPVHSQGLTLYTWASEVTSPPTSYGFSDIAVPQAVNFSVTATYRPGASNYCNQYAGQSWYSVGADYTPVADGGPAAPTASSWTNDPAPPSGDPQYIIAYTAARELAASTALISLGEVYPGSIPLGAHTVVDAEQSLGVLYNPWQERYISHYQQQFSYIPTASDVPYGYDGLAVMGGSPVTGLFQYTWGSYMLRVQEERVPYHPPTSDGKTWATETGTAKQLAAIEYRNGFLYQNAIGPVILPYDSRYNDTAWWAARRISAIELGLLKPDVSTPAIVTSWARRTS